MTRARVAAALAALITALLLQASLIGPVSLPVPVSLPAVLVAAVALNGGPGAGMALGFAAGLLADLSSRHPAGVLALCWLGVGLLAGRFADPYLDGPDFSGLGARARRRSLRVEVLIAAVVAALASVAATVILLLVNAGGASATSLLPHTAGAVLGDGVLALAIVPLVRVVMRSRALRKPSPMPTLVADRHG